jgi:hypothetical protein
MDYTSQQHYLKIQLFIKCFQKYLFDHKSFPICKQFEKTNLGFIIYENKKLVRLIDFHPIDNSEGLFFNVFTSVACAVGPSVTTSSTDFSF